MNIELFTFLTGMAAMDQDFGRTHLQDYDLERLMQDCEQFARHIEDDDFINLLKEAFESKFAEYKKK